MSVSPGKKFKHALKTNQPLPVVGAINAYAARLAQVAGHEALYVSGGGVAASSCGIPDLGITNADDVIKDVERITDNVDLPVLVDVDTGFGGAFNIARTIRHTERAGAAGVHIEDQVIQKRCGHRPNKAIVSVDEMCDRIKAAVDAKKDSDFMIMARTDALANEGLEGAIERCQRYLEAGADALFPEAFTELSQYKKLCGQVSSPVLANITEFGKTELFSQQELGGQGVGMVLYPLSAFRAMAKAALDTYTHIKQDGHQKAMVPSMQSRSELYEILGYHAYEQALDALLAK